jgi:hypothetical protein
MLKLSIYHVLLVVIFFCLGRSRSEESLNELKLMVTGKWKERGTVDPCIK